MSIKSQAFGRVTLTGQDAKKFINQVKYGRPSATATESVQAGIKLVRTFDKTGKVFVTVRAPGR